MPAATPLYQQIAADLREAIRSGKLPPGAQLPTEQELGQQYSVSRNTVRLAIGMLANEGMITATPGRGTFVRDQVALTYRASNAESSNRPVGETDAYFTEVRAQGREPSQVFEMRLVAASMGLANRLGVEVGESVVLRRCTREVDGQPWSIQDSYYPMDVSQLAGLLTPNDIPRGTVRAMADVGHVEVGYVDEVTTRMPTPDETHTLQLGAGVPVLVYVRTCYTTERPVRVTETIYSGDRNRLLFELGDLQARDADAPA